MSDCLFLKHEYASTSTQAQVQVRCVATGVADDSEESRVKAIKRTLYRLL